MHRTWWCLLRLRGVRGRQGRLDKAASARHPSRSGRSSWCAQDCPFGQRQYPDSMCATHEIRRANWSTGQRRPAGPTGFHNRACFQPHGSAGILCKPLRLGFDTLSFREQSLQALIDLGPCARPCLRRCFSPRREASYYGQPGALACRQRNARTRQEARTQRARRNSSSCPFSGEDWSVGCSLACVSRAHEAARQAARLRLGSASRRLCGELFGEGFEPCIAHTGK